MRSFLDIVWEEKKSIRREKHLEHLLKIFIKARIFGNFEKVNDIGFHIIPLLKSKSIEEIRALFSKVEKDLGF